jgi:tRNA pseudouridine(55) synthase
MATGVLPVFIGKATRIIEYSSIPNDPEAKIYRCRMKLGIETDTLDIWGKRVSDPISLIMPSEEEIAHVLKGFEGPCLQRPPLYSAVRVDGRKLYEYARKGQTPDEKKIREREVYIKQINVNHVSEKTGEIDFDVHCSKGVYIRTLCADAGRKLGPGAVMSGLIRLKSDGFSIDDAIQLDQLDTFDQQDHFDQNDKSDKNENRNFLEARLISMDKPLEWMPKIELPEDAARRFVLGQKVDLLQLWENSGHLVLKDGETSIENQQTNNPFVRVFCVDSLLGIGKLNAEGLLKPEKVLISV